jgi:hypothetical protein
MQWFPMAINVFEKAFHTALETEFIATAIAGILDVKLNPGVKEGQFSKPSSNSVVRKSPGVSEDSGIGQESEPGTSS